MASGKVAMFHKTKGFGFILSDDGQKVFVHNSKIQSDGFRELNEGQRVTFDIVQGPKGPAAENVHIER